MSATKAYFGTEYIPCPHCGKTPAERPSRAPNRIQTFDDAYAYPVSIPPMAAPKPIDPAIVSLIESIWTRKRRP